jgi:ATP/maltotriose-dependent transcriptional regulator MalT
VAGSASAYLGDIETGRTYVERGLKIQRDAGVEMFLSFAHIFLCDIHLHRGDPESARNSVEGALRLSQKNNEKYWEATAWIFLGRIQGRSDIQQIHKAEECMLQGMKMADELKTKPIYAQGHLFLGEIYAHSGQKEKARESLKKAEAMFQEMGMDYWLAETRKVSAGL